MANVVVPSVSKVAAKWARRAGSASTEYSEGVNNTSRSWATAAAAGEKNYVAGVTSAASAGRFGKGVAKAGDAKWKRGATVKGPARYSSGVAEAEQDYSSQVGPYLEAIGRVNLPERGPTGSEGNYARVSAIGKALRQLAQGK